MIETSIFHVNNNSFTGPLIIGTFEKRAPGPESCCMYAMLEVKL